MYTVEHEWQEGEKLQIYVRQDAVGEQNFNLYKMLDAGDIIGAVGISGDTSDKDEACAVHGIKSAGLTPDTGDPA